MLLSVQVNCKLFAQDSDCCDREAILFCDYNHPFMSNSEKERTEKEFSVAVFDKFQEVFNRNCFQVILPMPLDASNIPQNEYQIEVKHTQATNVTNWPNTRIEATLFLVAQGYREPVHLWEIEEPGDSLTFGKLSWPTFLDKLVNKINTGPEITEIVEKCEKRPVTLDIGCDKEELDPGEVIDVFLTGFKGKYGETSREFNRIVVQVSPGEIVNGAECELGEDYKAYRVENNFIKVRYRAPENCENPSVKFTIYNSCDILREQDLYMSKTQTKDRLLEKDFSLNCYDAKIKITGKYEKILKTSDKNTRDEEVNNYNLDESIDASVLIFFELIETQDMPLFNQTFQYYKPTSVSITDFNYTFESHRYMAGSNYETNVDVNRSPGKHEIDGKEYVSKFPWMLVIDNETGKAVKMIPAGYRISYEINETEKLNSVRYTNQGPKRESKTTTKTSSKYFELEPVGEKVTDPTVRKSDNSLQDYLQRQGIEIPAGVSLPEVSNKEIIKEINPDIVVKFGDGKSSFGGEGRLPVKKEMENGFEEENRYYKWEMTLKKGK